MAVHAGHFWFDRRPLGDRVEQVRAGLHDVLGDPPDLFRDDGLVMAAAGRQCWTGRGASEPVSSRRGNVVTLDGRLDNRPDLLTRLSMPASASDAAIALAAIERWGDEGYREILGDWSMAVWNSELRALTLARDYMGIRPLYYAADRDRVAWSTCLGELATRSGAVDAISKRFVATLISGRQSVDATPYQGVRMVPAASAISFCAGRATVRPFWSLRPGSIRYRDDRDYEVHLRALWRDAVACRLQSDEPVWAELSGGLDSSSVVCMADSLLRSGQVPAPSLRAVSHVTRDSREGDERRFIGAIERQTGIRSEVVWIEPSHHLRDADRAWITPYAASGVGLACLSRVGAGAGHILLSGRAGDAVMGGEYDNSIEVLDDVAGGHVLRAIGGVRAWSRGCRQPFIQTAWNVLRTSITDPERAPSRAADLLAPDVAGYLADTGTTTTELDGVAPSKRPLARMILGYGDGWRLVTPSPPPSIIYAYPFTHRPLVEFVLAIPGRQLAAPGEPRALMRRAFHDFVPERVLRRRSKGYYSPSLMRHLRTRIPELLPVRKLEVVSGGWLQAPVLEAALREVAQGSTAPLPEVWASIRLEDWLVSHARRAPADNPQRKEVRDHEVREA